MGKGDQKSKRGKIIRGSYGKTRPRKKDAKMVSASIKEQPIKAKKTAEKAEKVVKAEKNEKVVKVAKAPKTEKAEKVEKTVKKSKESDKPQTDLFE